MYLKIRPKLKLINKEKRMWETNWDKARISLFVAMKNWKWIKLYTEVLTTAQIKMVNIRSNHFESIGLISNAIGIITRFSFDTISWMPIEKFEDQMIDKQ